MKIFIAILFGFIVTSGNLIAQDRVELDLLNRVALEKDPNIRAEIYLLVANLYKQSNPIKSDKYVQKLSAILQSDTISEQTTLKVCYFLREIDISKRRFNSVLKYDSIMLFTVKKLHDSSLYYGVLDYLVIDLLNSERYKQAEKYLVEFKEITDKSLIKSNKAEYNRLMGLFLLRTQKQTKALEFFRKALAYYKGANKPRMRYTTEQYMIEAFIDRNELDSALHYFGEVSEYFQRSEEIFRKNELYVLLAKIYVVQGNVLSALEYLNKARLFFNSIQDDHMAALAGLDLATFYWINKKYDTAFGVLQNALDFFEKSEYLFGISKAKILLGSFYSEKHQFSKAEVYFRAASHLLKSSDYAILHMELNLLLAHHYYRLMKYQKADSLLFLYGKYASEHIDKYTIQKQSQVFNLNNPSINIEAKKNYQLLLQKDGVKQLASLQDGIPVSIKIFGDSSMNINYYSLRDEREDSLQTIRFVEATAVAEVKNKVNEIRDTLNKQVSSMKHIEERRNIAELIIKRWTLAGILLTIIILVMIVYAYKEIKARRKALLEKQLLEDKNKQILAEREVIEELYKVSRHLDDNGYANINSIIRIASRKFSRETLLSVESRIASLSRLHQFFRDLPGVKTLILQDILEDLVDCINSIFLQPDIIITTRITASAEVSIEEAKNIIKLSNELLTNSYKHAFSDRLSGEISISIIHQDNAVLFHYTDNGIGMPETYIAGEGILYITDLSQKLGTYKQYNDDAGFHYVILISK